MLLRPLLELFHPVHSSTFTGHVYTLKRVWCDVGRDFWFYCKNLLRKTGISVPGGTRWLGQFLHILLVEGAAAHARAPRTGLREQLPCSSLARREGPPHCHGHVFLPESASRVVFSEVTDLVESWCLCPVGQSKPFSSPFRSQYFQLESVTMQRDWRAL